MDNIWLVDMYQPISLTKLVECFLFFLFVCVFVFCSRVNMTLRVDDENSNTIDSIICQYYVSVIKSNLCVSHTCVKGALFRGTSWITVKLSQKNSNIADNCYSRHSFLTPRGKFKPNLSLYSGHPNLFVGREK